MSSELIMALDVGTQSSRAIAFDATGGQVAIGRAAHAPLVVGACGAVSQSPADVWMALQAAIAECVSALGDRATDVRAAALTTQRYTMIPCDSAGSPLMDAIHWLDRRTVRPQGSVLLESLCKIKKLRTIFASSRGHVLKGVEPDIYAQTERFLPLSAWLTQNLVGEAVDTAGSFPGLWPMDATRGVWHTHDRMAKLLAVQRDWLPRLVPAGEPLGALLPSVAAALGLPASIPVIAVGGDKQSELLGGGAIVGRPGIAAISLGTAASVTTVVSKHQEDKSARIYTTAAAQPNGWCLEYMLNRGMWMVTWLTRDLFRGVSIETLESEAETVSIGADGLTCVPRWGAPVAASHERGALLGFTEAHTRGHVYRAVIEGICLDLRQGLEVLESRAGQRFSDLRIGGGGSQSDWVVQVLANVLGREIRRGRTQELSALGAAVVGAVHLGWYDTIEAAACMTEGGDTISPSDAAQHAYEGVYGHRFKPRFRDLSRMMKRETGVDQ